MAKTEVDRTPQLGRGRGRNTFDAEDDPDRLDHHIGQAEGQQQRVIDAATVQRAHQKALGQQTDGTDRQRRQHQAEPEVAGQGQKVDAHESADHEEGTMGEIDHVQHAENKRQTERQQRIDSAQPDACHQLQHQ